MKNRVYKMGKFFLFFLHYTKHIFQRIFFVIVVQLFDKSD